MTSPAPAAAELGLEAIVHEALGTPAAPEVAPLLPILVRDLTEIDWRLDEALGAQYTRLSEAARYACSTGGKRIRPLLMAVVHRALGAEEVRPIRSLAAASQLIHTATLVHDDVIDHADLRRGRPSMPRAYGTPLAIVTGDYLFVRAFELAAEYPRSIILRSAAACADLVEGEVLQEAGRFDLSMTREQYYRIIDRKTAALISAALASVAEARGASDEVVRAAAAYGRALGLAFQLRDDLLDVFGDPDLIGKPLYTDLREGTPTLVSIEAFRALPSRAQAEFERLFSLRRKKTKHLIRLSELIRSTDVAAELTNEARQWAENAVRSLDPFPAGPYRELLVWLARGAVDRRF